MPFADQLPLIRHPRFLAGLVDSYTGSHSSARGIFEELADEASERGDVGSLPTLLTLQATAESRTGLTAEAEAHVVAALDLATEMSQGVRRSVAMALLGRLVSLRGDFDRASGLAERGLELGLTTGSMTGITECLALQGWIALSRDEPDAAAAAYQPLTGVLASRSVYEPAVARWIPEAIEAMARSGDVDGAVALLDLYQARAEALGRDGLLAACGRARGIIGHAVGDREASVAAFDSALVRHASAPEPFELARTQLAYGTVLRRSRAKRAARAQLESARQTFDDTGATWWTAKAARELDGIGAPASAVGELTPTEHRVADLVVEGRTNKEIAASLIMSPKTVEVHLSRIYRKVRVRSRTELAMQIRRKGHDPEE